MTDQDIHDIPEMGGANVILAPALDFVEATELAAKLCDLRHAPITIDASAVTHLGAPCLQVLMSASRTWAGETEPFNFVNPSSAFSDGLAELGLCIAELIQPGDRP